MVSPSPFDAKSNPLGTQNLEETYLVTADNFFIGQMYANVILSQPDLDVSQLDAGLATAISAFQARMKTNAQFVLTRLVPSFVTTVADGSNFGSLVDAGLTTGYNSISNAAQDANAAREAGELASAIASQAGEIGVRVNSLNMNYQQGAKANESYVNEYDARMSEAVNRLSDAAKQVSSEIDSLQEAIAQNIDDIVKGGDELGGAITNLTTGMLTQIFGSADEPKSSGSDGKAGDKKTGDTVDKEDEDDEEEDEEEDDEEEEEAEETGSSPGSGGDTAAAPNVSFAVQAIQAGVAGETKASAAMQALHANNQKLAGAYQRLAQENALITIAKVMQVQNKLFLKAFNLMGQNTGSLKTEWATVESAYTTFGQQIQRAEGSPGGESIQGARSLWRALGDQLSYIKNSMAHVM